MVASLRRLIATVAAQQDGTDGKLHVSLLPAGVATFSLDGDGLDAGGSLSVDQWMSGDLAIRDLLHLLVAWRS